MLPGLSFEIVRSSGPVLGIRADRVAMLALTERGPEETPTLVHSHDEFSEVFGSEVTGMLGPLAARAYFQNGGAELVVLRIVPKPRREGDPSVGLAQPAHAALQVVGASEPGLELAVTLLDRGAYGNRISVEPVVSLRRRARGTIVADDRVQFTGLLGPLFEPRDVGLPARALVSETGATLPNRWGRAAEVGELVGLPGTQTVRFSAPIFQGATGAALVELYEPSFSLRVVEPGRPNISVPGLDLTRPDELDAKLGAARLALDVGAALSTAELPLPGIVTRLRGGADGISNAADPVALDALEASFLRALEASELSELPDIVIAPDLWSRTFRAKGVLSLAFDAATATRLGDEMVRSAARRRDRVVILDPPLGGSDGLRPFGVEELERWRKDRENALLDARDFAATYTPWVRIVAGPVYRGDDTLLFPPSALVAGQMARTARDRGPWIATGNVPLELAIGLEVTSSVEDEERLQDIGINPLRMVLPRGATIQGVRALSWPDRRPWRFLSTRRLFNFLRRAIRPIALSYAFEPNAEATWISLRRDVERLLRDMFARGAFAGARPEDGFFVKIDDELNPEEARDNGVLTAQIGVAPAFPLEFLVVRLSVGRGIADLTEEPIVR